jgi:hypothetical protein
MAAAAHDIGCTEHDRIAGLGRLARGFFVDRKFGDADALRAKCLSHGGARIVVREHFYAGHPRCFRQPRDRGRDVAGARDDALHQAIEFLIGMPQRSTICARFRGAALAMVDSM